MTKKESSSSGANLGCYNTVDHFIDIVLATKENTRNVGWLITDDEGAIEDEVNIPFYSNVTEGRNFEEADWKDEVVVRQAKISWKEDNTIVWLERHMEMTQGFILVGKNPGLMILGEPTHDRDDLSENERNVPDIRRLTGYIVPAGCGIIIKKGTWHDFPVSVGPDITVFILNTREVVDALMNMKEAGPMDFGDCYKIKNADTFQNLRLCYPDPRPIIKNLGLLPNETPINDTDKIVSIATCVNSKLETLYGKGMERIEVPPNWAGENSSNVWVVPVINVETFEQDEFGPSVQPHLNKNQPEIANKGWREYGNKQGLHRLGNLFRNHNIVCTAVVSSDLVNADKIKSQLRRLKQNNGWEIGAHGTNNSNGGHAGLTVTKEKDAILRCISPLETTFGSSKRLTWLTPGFSVTSSTPQLLLEAGVGTLLDFTDDDKPFLLIHDKNKATDQRKLVCLPYCMETNDFSLILTRNLSPREYAAALESHILQLAKESRESCTPTVVCLGMHTFVAGTPAVVHELDKMLSRLKHSDNITWATAEQVSNAILKGTRTNERLSTTNVMNSPSILPFETQGVVQKMLHQHFFTKPSNLINIIAAPYSLQVNTNGLGLILIDMQHDFLSPFGFGETLGNNAAKLDRIIAPTKRVLNIARSTGLTIIHTRECHRPNLIDVTRLKIAGCPSIGTSNGKGRSMVKGEWGSQFISEVAPLNDDSETIIDKSGKGSFYQTDLDLVLRNAAIDTLIVCGVTTEVCVHSTVREATDRGIRCIVLKDCTASYFDEFHNVGIDMIASQGGIFGSVSDSKSIVDALSR